MMLVKWTQSRRSLSSHEWKFRASLFPIPFFFPSLSLLFSPPSPLFPPLSFLSFLFSLFFLPSFSSLCILSPHPLLPVSFPPYVTQVGLEFLVFLPKPSEYWNYRQVPPWLPFTKHFRELFGWKRTNERSLSWCRLMENLWDKIWTQNVTAVGKSLPILDVISGQELSSNTFLSIIKIQTNLKMFISSSNHKK